MDVVGAVECERHADRREGGSDGRDQGPDLTADPAAQRDDAEHDVRRREREHPCCRPVPVARVVEHRPAARGRGRGVHEEQ